MQKNPNMEEKKKMGRPSQGKGWMSFSLDQEVVDFLKSLPDGERSKFVNEAIAEKIEKVKEQQKFFAKLEGKEL
jgi:hypothetical protein